jgi:hypothetical protein
VRRRPWREKLGLVRGTRSQAFDGHLRGAFTQNLDVAQPLADQVLDVASAAENPKTARNAGLVDGETALAYELDRGVSFQAAPYGLDDAL